MQALGKDVRDSLALLDKHGVRYLIVGGFAVAVHGTPRYTKDLDIWVDRASLIANKRALGRPQDLVDAEDLER